MKLKASIASNSRKVIEIYNQIFSGSLVTGPYYQRNLVWKKQHKFAFIKTILENFPFPEVYIASSEVDVENLQAREVVVDGQQRLTTIVDYIKGANDFQNQKTIPSFNELSIDDKKEFLNYSITVKDLKDIGEANIREVFKRINSTDYSLNSNEILNAEYGGGEFAIFCKLLADKKFSENAEITNIHINHIVRNQLVNFFTKNDIFSENDVKRMFDIQYIMLISATILNGGYFGRSSKINYYLERYNITFDAYPIVLKDILNAVNLISDLKLSSDSYWYNKANLFILVIEFSKIEIDTIDKYLLESKLLELERKVDIYFTEDDITSITDEERKYFEYARQGSHELAAREHRAMVIKRILNESSIVENQIKNTNTEVQELKELNSDKIQKATLIPTATGLNKSIMDAVLSVREFLKSSNIHDYDNQQFGQDFKVKLKGKFILKENVEKDTEISLYRSNGRGDYRIWFSDLKTFANPNDELVLVNNDGVLNIFNTTRFTYE